MSHRLKIVFFGSFQDFSVIILEKLLSSPLYHLSSIITTPPRPAGRHLKLTPTPVQIFAEKHHLPVFTPENLDDQSLSELKLRLKSEPRPDFLVVAGFGKLIPLSWLNLPRIMAVNAHQSLLPQYRGRCPAEWAILNGEIQTGITLMQMTEKFDQGPILVQESLPITTNDTRLTLYNKLYTLASDMLIKDLPLIASGQITPHPQPTGNYFYARQITREDGFIPWTEFSRQLSTSNDKLARQLRAFAGWPGVWSESPQGARVKLLQLYPPIVQIAGKSPLPWSQAAVATTAV